MKNKRFARTHWQLGGNMVEIIVDNETGVNYLLAFSNMNAASGLCVLVDAEGKPIVTPNDGSEPE